MPDIAMCGVHVYESRLGKRICHRSENCHSSPLSGAVPGYRQSWANWWETWKDDDQMTCRGYIPVDCMEKNGNNSATA